MRMPKFLICNHLYPSAESTSRVFLDNNLPDPRFCWLRLRAAQWRHCRGTLLRDNRLHHRSTPWRLHWFGDRSTSRISFYPMDSAPPPTQEFGGASTDHSQPSVSSLPSRLRAAHGSPRRHPIRANTPPPHT